MKKRLFITGASGYVGRQLACKLLHSNQYEIYLLQSQSSKLIPSFKKNYHIIFYDTQHFNVNTAIRDINPDVVVHLAGCFVGEHTFADIESLVNSNITFGTEILDAMREYGVKRFINTSTYWVDCFQNNKYSPVNLYAAMKKSFENILKYYVEVHNFRAITLRLYDIYGPDDNRGKIIPTLIEYARSHKKLSMSPAEQNVDFVYIDDVIDAYISAISYLLENIKPVNSIADIGSGDSIQLKDCVSIVEEVFDSKIDVSYGTRNYRSREVMHAKANINKSYELLKWKPKYALKAGLLKIKEKEND